MRWLFATFGACLLVLLLGVAALGQESSDARDVWHKSRIGSVAVGDTEGGLYFVYYFEAFGPKLNSQPAIAPCLRRATDKTSESFRATIANNIKGAGRRHLSDPVHARETAAALAGARAVYKAEATICASQLNNASEAAFIRAFELGLSKDRCTTPTCEGVGEYAIAAQSRDPRRIDAFEAIFFWAIHNRLETHDGGTVLLSASESGGVDPLVIERAQRPSPALDAVKAQRIFEAAVIQARSSASQRKISETVAGQIGLARTVVLRTPDAFADPHAAYSLAAANGESRLLRLQDEVARSRLMECSFFQAQSGAAAIARCAGYQLNQTALTDCLSGGACMPDLAADANAAALLVAHPVSLARLSERTVVPRPFAATFSFGDLTSRYAACAQGAKLQAAVDQCLGDELAGLNKYRSCQRNGVLTSGCLSAKEERLARSVECLRGNGPTIACLTDSATAARIDGLSKCKDARAPDACLADKLIPPEWERSAACVRNAKSAADLVCLDEGLLEGLGKDVSSAGAAAKCLATNPDDSLGAFVCMTDGRIDPRVANTLKCIQSASSTSAGVTCALSNQLPGSAGQLARCAADAGFDPVGTGTCMAARDLDPGQRIILQCAAMSGGDPASTSACALGQFTIKELRGCQTKDFGESGCFGENNEVQRFAKFLTGETISRSSVVGQVAVAHIQVAGATLASAEHVTEQLSEGAKQLERGIDHELEKIARDPVKAALDAPGNVVDEAMKGLKNGFKKLL